jgi:DNA-binding PadR family transcriptional regulator
MFAAEWGRARSAGAGATECPAGDLGCPLFRTAARGVSDLLSQVRDAVRGMSAGYGPGWGGGPWEWGAKRKSRWAGQGGFGGPWGGPWPGPPGFARGPKAGRGDVRAAILALLKEGPRNGYQIMSEIEERSEGAWRPSPGAVYPALAQLADEGLIEAEESGGRRTFSLTAEGRRYVEENPRQARAAWESMTEGAPGEMPGLFVQAARLGGSIVQVAREGTPEQIRAAEALLEQTRREMYRLLAGHEPGGQEPSGHEPSGQGPGGQGPGGQGPGGQEPGGQDDGDEPGEPEK